MSVVKFINLTYWTDVSNPSFPGIPRTLRASSYLSVGSPS